MYLLFCWTFIPAIVALIEGIIYLTMTDVDFYNKYVLKIKPKKTKQPWESENK